MYVVPGVNAKKVSMENIVNERRMPVRNGHVKMVDIVLLKEQVTSECIYYHPQEQVGKGFTHVCLCVCLSLFPGDNF